MSELSGSCDASNAAHASFLTMLPAITHIACRAFRGWRRCDLEELIADTIANAFAAYTRLCARGAADRAFPTPLGHFAVKQSLEGRRVGGRLNANDVLSHYCQRRRRIKVMHVDDPHVIDRANLREHAVVNRRTSPSETATFRIDFENWLGQLPARHRRVAMCLATGETTDGAAVRFGVSRSRISQMRAELRRSWKSFRC